jgi:PhnB protein
MVKTIPEGFRTLTPHLVVKNASQAIEFYKKALGAEVNFTNYLPDGKTVVHAQLKIGNSLVMLADEFPQSKCVSPQTLGGTTVILHVYVDDVDSLWKRAISAGGTETMPLMDAFWGDRYGQITDPFGHIWSLATHKEDVTPEEMQKRGDAIFSNMKF